jgi:uncharacterized protein with HEPN domain
VTKDAAERINDMRIYGETVGRLLASRSVEDFSSDEALRYAVQYLLLVVGEASVHVPEGVRETMPDIPWIRLRGLRNRLAHGYFALDPAMVYLTAVTSIPDLLRRLDRYKIA